MPLHALALHPRHLLLATVREPAPSAGRLADARRHQPAQAETTWLETGKGLSKKTVEELRKLSQPHGPNSRAARQRATEEEGAA